jgi:hypothetical protein
MEPRKTMSVSVPAYEKLVELSSQEAIKLKRKVAINDILERDYLGKKIEAKGQKKPKNT